MRSATGSPSARACRARRSSAARAGDGGRAAMGKSAQAALSCARRRMPTAWRLRAPCVGMAAPTTRSVGPESGSTSAAGTSARSRESRARGAAVERSGAHRWPGSATRLRSDAPSLRREPARVHARRCCHRVSASVRPRPEHPIAGGPNSRALALPARAHRMDRAHTASALQDAGSRKRCDVATSAQPRTAHRGAQQLGSAVATSGARTRFAVLESDRELSARSSGWRGAWPRGSALGY